MSKPQTASSMIVRSGLKMSIATFISRILGLVREQAMAIVFGASSLTDAFLVAYRIPNLLRDLLAEGAFSAAFVPVFTEVNNKSHEEANQLLWSIAFLLGIITAVIGLLIYVLAGPLIDAFAPSFISDPEKYQTTVFLTRWMAPYLMCVCLAALFTGVLNVLRQFFIPSLAPAAFNVVMIGFCFGLTPVLRSMGYNGIYSLSIAVFIGGIVQVLLQIPLLLKKGHYPLWPKPLISPLAARVVKRLGPGLIGFAASQLNLLVTTILASSIVGAVSWLSYAFRLLQFPVGIFGVAIANSHLVHFSHAIKSGDYKKAQEFLQVSYVFSLMILLPATALLYLFSHDIIQLIFQHGRFTPSDTEQTTTLLMCYALGLPFYGLYKILVPSFYSLDRQNIPIFLTLISLAINIIFCLVFTPLMGVKTLAIGTSLTMALNAFGCIWKISPLIELPPFFFLNKRILKLCFATIVTAIFCSYAITWGHQWGDSFTKTLILLVVISTLSLGIYFLVLVLLRELDFMKSLVRRH